MPPPDTPDKIIAKLTIYVSTLVMTCPLCKTVNSAGVNKEMVIEIDDSISIEIKCRKCKSDFELSGCNLTLDSVKNGPSS